MTPTRVLLLTASVGGGHDGPAREIARRLRERGHVALIRDLIRIGPGGRLLRFLFHVLVLIAPRGWGAVFAGLEGGGPLPGPLRLLVARTGARVARLIEAEDIDLVVSTFPLGGAVAAAARRRTARDVRIAAYLTDPAVHRIWIEPAVDLYLSTWSFGPAQIARFLDTPVAVVAPAVRPAFRADAARPGTSTAPTRLALGLPLAPLALVASGSWGVGDVTGMVRDLLAETDLVPVVACGGNRRLRRRVARIPGAVALGWVDDMAALMRACTVAVLNSGGLTLAEAATIGLAVVHHRPLPGQGVSNADVCAAASGSDPGGGLTENLAGARALTDRLGTADPLGPLLALTGPVRAVA